MSIKGFYRFISAAFCAAVLCAATPSAHAKLATVGAVHEYAKQIWGVDIAYNPARRSNIPNLKYLMQFVDLANLKLNGWVTSDFSNDPDYFTDEIAADTAGRDAVNILIEKVEWKFFFTPATTTNEYSFNISAAGRFYIDWGDGQKEFIHKKDVNMRTISHTYTDGTAANTHEIKLGGHATRYSADETTAAISFCDKTYIEKYNQVFPANPYGLSAMRGCVGCVFSTLPNGDQPRFYQTFVGNIDLASELPENLFNGVKGQPVSNMFEATFWGDSKITGPIPENLFADIRGEPVRGMFFYTFFGCSSLTGSIPGNLFAGISGAPAERMFQSVFTNCSKLTGSIPATLFAGIAGAPKAYMYQSVFYGCTGLTGEIPVELFAGIDPASSYVTNMFYGTFYQCVGLTGPSARIGDKYLYEIWPASGGETYNGASGLSDWACIPRSWAGPGTKKPGECEPAAGGADE